MILKRKAVLDDPPRVEVGRWAITRMFSTHAPTYSVGKIHEIGPCPTCPPDQISVKLDCAWVPPSSVTMTCGTEEDGRIWVAEDEVERVKEQLTTSRELNRDLRKKLRSALDLIATFKDTVKGLREFDEETPPTPSTGS